MHPEIRRQHEEVAQQLGTEEGVLGQPEEAIRRGQRTDEPNHYCLEANGVL